jgi:argininosuccinate lyase
MFADLNRHAIRPSKSLGLLYDQRNDAAKVGKLVALKSEAFKGMVELERNTLSERSRKLFTVSALCSATSDFLGMREFSTPDEAADDAIAYWDELAKHIHAFARDLDRIQDWLKRTSVSPLGSGALAGSSLPLAPEKTAKSLGFTSSSANSIDGVSDRDFVAEAVFIASLIGVHLSRIGEEWCIWATTEFGWAKVADAYSTGSSIMPQKKNPDMAELARGKAGRLVGNLTGVLTMLKGLPFAYNRDLQEDKEPLFDSIDTLLLVLPAVTGMVSTTDFDREKMALAAPLGFSLATEIADYLVRAHVPFAEAHEAAGKCVAICETSGRQLHQMSDEEFASVHPELKANVRDVLTVHGALESRTTIGGTSPASFKVQIDGALKSTAASRKEFQSKAKTFSEMMGQ